MTCAAAVGEDRGQIALAKAAGGCRGGQHLIHPLGPVQLGQRHGLSDLALQSGRPGGRGLGQPLLRAASPSLKRG